MDNPESGFKFMFALKVTLILRGYVFDDPSKTRHS